MILRTLRLRDAGALQALRRAALTECPSAFGTDPEWELRRNLAHYESRILQAGTRRRERLMGLWDGSQLAGMTGLGGRRRGAEGFGLIYSMYIYPEYRGRGLSRQLLESCESCVGLEWELPACRITVECGNLHARSIYTRFGFTFLHRESAAFHLNGVSHDVDHLEKRISPPPDRSAPPPRGRGSAEPCC
jgi:ribosomal protein S18 acetylase RimI-like enzyme